jgi:hypothetical protein
MSRLVRAAVLAATLLAAAAVPAGAHLGNPSYRSVVRGLAPSIPGLQVQVVGYDDHLELTNRTGRAVVVYGYQREPYARVLADGTVQVNDRSPAEYLNEDRFGTTPVPASAKPSAPPHWRTLDRTGRFSWHDHRMHWMAQRRPSQVTDASRKTKIFDYRIPLRVAGQAGAIDGTLYWVGTAGPGFPVAAVVSLVVLVLLAVGAVALVRRRRAAEGDDGAGTPREQPPAKEAW